MVLEHIEIDKETNLYYVSGFMRNPNNGVFDYGFVGILDETNSEIVDIRTLNEQKYRYLSAYKSWEIDGFTEKSLQWNYTLKNLKNIIPVSIKSTYNSTKN